MRADVLGRRGLFLPWVAFASVCLWAMLAYPGNETVPYHLGWIALAIAYYLNPWPFMWAFGAVSGYIVVSGWVLVERAHLGIIPWEETTEIPLMGVLVSLMIWNVSRRHHAMLTLGQLRAQERQMAQRREHLARLVSHEIKTTLTIAGGHLDLVAGEPLSADARSGVETARDEVRRLDRASDRLLRMMVLEGVRTGEIVDLDALLVRTMERWEAVSPPRDWRLDTHAGILELEPLRLRACLDTLIENSLRYTGEGDTIRLVGFRRDGEVCLGVADSGPGFSEGMTEALNSDHGSRSGTNAGQPGVEGPAIDGGRGLGLGIVQETARASGGSVRASQSEEGGALLLMVLPLRSVGPADRGAPPTTARTGSRAEPARLAQVRSSAGR